MQLVYFRSFFFLFQSRAWKYICHYLSPRYFDYVQRNSRIRDFPFRQQQWWYYHAVIKMRWSRFRIYNFGVLFNLIDLKNVIFQWKLRSSIVRFYNGKLKHIENRTVDNWHQTSFEFIGFFFNVIQWYYL